MKRILILVPPIAILLAIACTEKSPATQDPGTDPGTSSIGDPGYSVPVDPGFSSWVDPGYSSAIYPVIDPSSSSYFDPNPNLSSSSALGLSSAENPILSSNSIPIPSSSSVDPATQVCGGKMPAPISGGQSGWATRYWDCCKPSCSWYEKTLQIGAPNGIAKNCNIHNQDTLCFTPANNQGTVSGCESGPAFTCYSQVPWAVCDNLSYGYVAVQASSPQCGKCFQIDFTGEGKYGTKPAHQLLKGKSMIVIASNTGGDVGNNHFDIMIPGGGFGNYTSGCATQWGVDPNNTTLVGANRGGFLSKCQESLGYDATPAQYKSCVRTMCNNLFGSKPEMAELLDGCLWFVDWFETADNPMFLSKEVTCPAELIEGYKSSLH